MDRTCKHCERLSKRTRAAVHCKKGHRVYPEPKNATAAYARDPEPGDPNFSTYLSWSRAGEPNTR